MHTAEAQIPTERAGRYLEQLCRHLGQLSRMRHQAPAGHRGQAPPPVQHVDWSDSSGMIRFTHGTCTLQATPTALLLRVDADDEDSLRRLQDGITCRLATIGRRDHLTVDWQRPDPPSDNPPSDSTAAPTGPTRPTATVPGPHRLGRTLALTAVAALALLVHLGLLGGAIATSAWASWGTNIILALVLVKVLAAGIHLARVQLGRRGKLVRGHAHHSSPTSIDPDKPHRPARTGQPR